MREKGVQGKTAGYIFKIISRFSIYKIKIKSPIFSHPKKHLDSDWVQVCEISENQFDMRFDFVCATRKMNITFT